MCVSTSKLRVINDYGSRRGMVQAFWHKLLYYVGWYRKYRQVDWNSVERVVFVCKGNICRSVYAEAVARSLGIETISCGINAIADAPADAVAVRTAMKKGISLEKHKSLPLMGPEFRSSDLLVAMEPWQAGYLKRYFYNQHHVTLLGLWCRPVYPYLHDPYATSQAYFEKCFHHIEQSVHGISEKIKK